VIVRPGHDEAVGIEVIVIDHLPRLGALHPEMIGHVLLAKDTPDLGSDDVVDPVHGDKTLK
jgi:hypothetical protein